MENSGIFGYYLKKLERRIQENEGIKKDEGYVEQGDCP
jgi:hypothetical protein